MGHEINIVDAVQKFSFPTASIVVIEIEVENDDGYSVSYHCEMDRIKKDVTLVFANINVMVDKIIVTTNVPPGGFTCPKVIFVCHKEHTHEAEEERKA